ncbi:MAG: prepilin-type N-terminal cleavage/methylation domain-containing protein [Epsilonproteobacteria bacterium]|nr:prepilin-type N-terminal cleavage/methylation domain-containing protein [Campylobacterota bacterium]
MKKSFTLIEVLLSIAILSILFLAMSNVVGVLKTSKNALLSVQKKEKKKELLIKTIYSDILNANKIKIIKTENPNYIRLYIRTKNSLYNNILPYVMWYVSKNQNTLIRAESYKEINFSNDTPPNSDIFAKNLKKFKIYQKKGKYLIYLGVKKPLYFEMYNPVNTQK